jgi:hypothetical protein
MVWLCAAEGSEEAETVRLSTDSFGSMVTGRSPAAIVRAITNVARLARDDKPMRDDKRAREDRSTRGDKSGRGDDWGQNPSGYSTTSRA